MADVTANKYQVGVPRKVTKTEYVDEERVSVTMDVDTARVLGTVLANVGGVTSGPRGAVNELLTKLNEAGVERFNRRKLLKRRGWESGGYIQLADEWPEENESDDLTLLDKINKAAQGQEVKTTPYPYITSPDYPGAAFHRARNVWGF